MVARGWGVLPIHRAHRKEQGHAPIPAGDREGRPYSSGRCGFLDVLYSVWTKTHLPCVKHLFPEERKVHA
jgi:hypothetical protein